MSGAEQLTAFLMRVRSDAELQQQLGHFMWSFGATPICLWILIWTL